MGKLTKDMARLCREIEQMRAGRRALRKELAEENKKREVEVVEICATFADTLSRRAKRSQEGRRAFLKSLRQRVAEQMRDTRNDLTMARRVWVGKTA